MGHAVGEAVVYLVGDDDEVASGGQVGDLGQVLAGHLGAGGVGGVAQEDGLGALRAVGFQVVGADAEVVLHAGGDGDEGAAGELAGGQVGHVVGVGAEELVAGVEDGHEGQHEALGHADGDEDLVAGVVADAVEPF